MSTDLLETRTLFSPSPKKPTLVCGLPGSGYVGKLATDYLAGALEATKFMEFYSPSFPPQVNVDDEGRAEVMRGELLHAQTKQGRDLLIFTADAQPNSSLGEYQLSDALLKEARRMGTEQVYSLAAYITGDFGKERRVFGTATSEDLLPRLRENGVSIMREGAVTGMNGLVIGIAKLHEMAGVCLLGETSGYIIDPAASAAVLQSFCKIIGLEIDLTGLQEKAKEAQQIISQIQRMTDQGTVEARGKDEGRPGYIG